MKGIYKPIGTLLAAASLAGCVTANTLGISNAQWQQYSSQQRNQMIDSYYQNQAVMKKAQENQQLGDKVIAVTIEGGDVLMSPFVYAYQYRPIHFTIREGECPRALPIYSSIYRKSTTTSVCYKDNTLYIDPSLYDVNQVFGSVSFAYLPVWQREYGFTYPDVNTIGYAHFRHARVTIKQLND